MIALLHTASLYQKDLDRQLMLEKATRDVQIKSHDHGKELMDRLNKIATSSREMNSRLNLIVWALNPKYNNLENLVSYLRRYFGEYLENFGIRFKTALPDRIPDLSITPDTRRNIFYAIQEAIHNAVKHSSCSEISLVVKIDQQNMEITITDNGKGFDQLKPGSGGNGLLNMRKRAEELGGSFEINSLPSKGTKVMLIFRL